ncbi:MAG: hypothetical protein KME55_16735 [Nostoc indistinguendum CM1-VF10]|nr:hypothetical protein [Nostoc indistinguendum CM1-VF10]
MWQRVFEALAEDADNEYAMIDSTIVCAYQHSAGAKGEMHLGKPSEAIIDSQSDRGRAISGVRLSSYRHALQDCSSLQELQYYCDLFSKRHGYCCIRL